jgi:transcriptional regulator with XRE-family HTH domain
MTQQQLGEALEPAATRASIANIEAGKQRVLAHTLVQLANAVGASLNELLPAREEIRAEAIREELLQKLELPEKQLRRVVDKLTPRNPRKRK